METLRIKCPSCGIVLEVRNSKNEKVKKITCPNCQKQLAITFGDMAAPVGSLYEGTTRYQLNEGANAIPGIPSGLVELRVVRLKDGTPKHILRALTGEQKVEVNGQSLMQDDEVVLQQGDEISMEDRGFSFDKPQTKHEGSPKKYQDDPVIHEKKANEDSYPSIPSWIIWLATVVVVALLIIFLWPTKQVRQPRTVEKDTLVKVIQQKELQKKVEPKKLETYPVKEKKQENRIAKEEDDNDFALEVEASEGNTMAQYQLGMRWITSSDRSEVLKGVQYLQEASRSGNANAQYALGIVYGKGSSVVSRDRDLSLQYMRQAAANGNKKAQRYLEMNGEE